ncbi:hypothetical protein DPEC_G00104800 [Dallia pectoralis]|uniref:Uncharacterized protein n=1 Tax=Dallia pectoralis TaxID=75939 RepID=A0ACC2GY64_DALPE|nr:hypothetical protein DPEC_G00104800 [Dallia pectoralis]
MSNIFSTNATLGYRYNGLYNQGQTCYLNSVLQVMFMTEDFREAVESYHKTCKEQQSCDCELNRLFNILKKENGSTNEISLKLGIKNGQIHQDASKYFVKILDMVKAVNPDASKIFEGQLRHTTTCSKSQHKTTHETDSFWTLPISVNVLLESDRGSVVDGIAEFFMPTILKGEMMNCDKCGETEATMAFEMVNHPKILTVLLKRFEFNFTSKTCVKINRQVDVPYRLSIENCEYELYAIVDHFGSLGGGHYTATIKSNEDSMWYHFNDSNVQQLTTQPFKENVETTRSAYLLMYKCKKTGNDRETNMITDRKTENNAKTDEDKNKKKVDKNLDENMNKETKNDTETVKETEKTTEMSINKDKKKAEKSTIMVCQFIVISPTMDRTTFNMPGTYKNMEGLTVKQLKTDIFRTLPKTAGIPEESLKLTVNSRMMDEEALVSSFKFHPMSVIHIVAELHGGQ